MLDHEIHKLQAEVIYKRGLENVKNTPEPKSQKFRIGARVKIADDLKKSMSHFPKSCLATVQYTYAHAYGGNDIKSYSLDVDGVGSVAWYEEYQLEAV